MTLFKQHFSLFSIATLTVCAVLVNLLVGWIVWTNSQDEFSTLLAVLIVTLSFFFSPVKKRV